MHLNKRLSTIQDKQEKNKQMLAEHDRFEEQLEAFHQREMRLFGWLHDVWRKDKVLRDSLEHDRLELQHERQKIAQNLHDKKQTFTKEKLYLLNAEEEFGDYIAKDPDNLDKVVEILKYEDAHPDDAKKVTEFLSPLEEQDVMEIKFLMYTAEEPLRTISMKYLDRFNIRNTNSGGSFDSSENAIDFNIENDRDNNRGKYYTFFHEIFYAVDYYHGIEQGYNRHYSNFYGFEEGNVLNDYMEHDAETHFRQELEKELQNPKYDALSGSEKQEMIDNVTDNLMIQDDYYDKLSSAEKDLNNRIRSHYEKILHGPAHNTASDVYGGITNFVISGNYGHQDEDGNPSDYWFVNAEGGVDGERRRGPNRGCKAATNYE